MKVFDDVWHFPDGEEHLPKWMTRVDQRVDGRLTYQYNKYEPAITYCSGRRRAVDIGSHVGLWAYWMTRDFESVDAFEPKSEHCECWRANVPSRPGVKLHEVALGEMPRRVGLHTGALSSGNTTVVLTSATPIVDMRTLDSFGFDDVDFIKIDTDGYEYFVLAGALETIKRCRPIVIVEQKHGGAQRYGVGDVDAVNLLQEMGAQKMWNCGGDYLMTFPQRKAAA